MVIPPNEVEPPASRAEFRDVEPYEPSPGLNTLCNSNLLDIAGLMAFEGFPIASTFPGEGNPQDHGSWRLTEGSETSAEAAEFINFASVSGTPALTPAYAAYLDEAEIIKEEWEKMLAA